MGDKESHDIKSISDFDDSVKPIYLTWIKTFNFRGLDSVLSWIFLVLVGDFGVVRRVMVVRLVRVAVVGLGQCSRLYNGLLDRGTYSWLFFVDSMSFLGRYSIVLRVSSYIRFAGVNSDWRGSGSGWWGHRRFILSRSRLLFGYYGGSRSRNWVLWMENTSQVVKNCVILWVDSCIPIQSHLCRPLTIRYTWCQTDLIVCGSN